MDPNQYRKLTPIDHIYKNPSFYVGSEHPNPRLARLFDFESKRVLEAEVSLAPAIKRLFIEVLSNASDHVFDSRSRNINPAGIEINVTPTEITVINGGLPIPVEINRQTQLYVPEMIFGHLLTSSHYDGPRQGGGLYGIGVKAVNVLSSHFEVEVGDHLNRRRYFQSWGKKMSPCEGPVIEAYSGPSFVRVTYELDFERFGLECYPDEVLGIFYQLAAEVALSTCVPVVFNEQVIPVSNVQEYGSLFFGDVKSLMLDPEVILTSKPRPGGRPLVTPKLSVGLFDTPEEGLCLGWVNGLPVNAGVHLQSVVTALLPFLATIKLKGKTSQAKLTRKDLLTHLSIFVVVQVTDPEFNAATKDELTNPKFKVVIPESVFVKLKKFTLTHHLFAALQGKKSMLLGKNDGKKRHFLELSKGEDANFAGGKQAEDCTLMLVEGNSAESYATEAISLQVNGRDTWGVYPLRGKLLNVHDCSADRQANNRELSDLKQMLGLRHGVDYKQPENFRTLRYGHCLIMTDEDEDGKHIKGLILNFFYCEHPSLLERGFILYLRTPILRVFKGKHVLKFFNQHEYKQWREVTPDYTKWTHKYYKGLGTSTNEDVADDFGGEIGPRLVVCLYDDETPEAMDLAFSDKYADERKQWIVQHQAVCQTAEMTMQSIADFIYDEYIEYCLATLPRAIPSSIDGLKESQRKNLWAAFLKWGHTPRTRKDSMKVARFGAYVAERTEYHHGETCPADTLIKMARDFVGSNNLPYFARDGQFGTRNAGGKDAASARYIFTYPEWWINLVFREEDWPVLTQIVDEGKKVEPVTFFPIIPMVLVNGADGTAVGFHTFIPNYHPLELIDWIRRFLTHCTDPPPQLIPWYRGFTGDIRLERGMMITSGRAYFLEPGPRKKDAPTIGDPLPEGVGKRKKIKKTEHGSPTRTERASAISILIEELPIGLWTADYARKLITRVKAKELMDTRNLSKTETVNFIVQAPDTLECTLTEFGLITRKSLRTLVLLDRHSRPRFYPDPEAVMDEFIEVRLDAYDRRRQHIIGQLKTKIREAETRARFILAVKQKEIVIFDRLKSEIFPEMEARDFPRELLDKVKTSEYTLDEVRRLEGVIRELDNQLKQAREVKSEVMWLEELDVFEEAYRKHYKE